MGYDGQHRCPLSPLGRRMTPRSTPRNTPRSTPITILSPRSDVSSLRLSGSFIPAPPLKEKERNKVRGRVKMRAIRLGADEKKAILEWPAEYKQCPVVDKMLLTAFLTLFNHITDDDGVPLGRPFDTTPEGIEATPTASTKRSDNDELYRVYIGLCSNHSADDYSDMSEAGFVAYLYRLGWTPLRQPVMAMLLNRAKRLANTATFNYVAFVIGLLLLAMMFDDPESPQPLNHEMIVYAAFEKALKGILVPAHMVKVDGKLCSDVRWNSSLNDLIYVYWTDLDRSYKKYCCVKKRVLGNSGKLTRTLANLLEYEGWLAFATDSGLDRWLTDREMAQILKVAQASDKEDIIDYAVPADRAFLGKVCLDMAEFFNAITRCALRILRYEDPAVWTPAAKLHRLLYHIFGNTRDLDFDVPQSPFVLSITPNACNVSDTECKVVVKGLPLCKKRGVYFRFEGVKTGMGRFERHDDKEAVSCPYPVFPEAMRYKEPSLARLADMEAWRMAVTDQRKRARLWNMTLQRVCIPEPVPQTMAPYKTVLTMNVSPQGDGMVITPSVAYHLDLSLSNDGLHFSHSDGLSSQVSYVESMPSYAVSAETTGALRVFFQLYCAWNDPYNDSLMTVEKWRLFKNHFELVEPCLPVYSCKRRPVKRMRKKRVVMQEGDLWTSGMALRRGVETRVRQEWFTKEIEVREKVVRKERVMAKKNERDVHYIVPGTEIVQLERPDEEERYVRVELYNVEAFDDNVTGVECPLFDEMSTLHPRFPIPTLTFSSFISLLARICSDVNGKLDCRPFFASLCEARVLLPRTTRPSSMPSEVAAPQAIRSVVERPVRQYDVFGHNEWLGTITQGGGWVVGSGGKRVWNPHLTFVPTVSGAWEVEKVVSIMCIDDFAYEFTSILLRVVGRGYLLAPSTGKPPRGMPGRVYCVTHPQSRPTGGMMLLRPDAHVLEPIKATTVAAHIWESKGTISTLWWQAVAGELEHPQATMVVYGEDPALHLYRLFTAFTTTQTLAGLRKAIEDLGYTLSLL